MNQNTEINKNSKIMGKLLNLVETYNTIYANYKESIDNSLTDQPADTNKYVKKIDKINKAEKIEKKDNIEGEDDEIIDLLDSINDIDYLDDIPTKKRYGKKVVAQPTRIDDNIMSYDITSDYKYLINKISDIVISDDKYEAYKTFKTLELNIVNTLIKEILENTPKTDVTITKFTNIKTQLYPYQINNVNWMIDIEKSNYTEEFADIKNKIIFKGGGLFDEVGMGKTLQIITLINHLKSNYDSKIKNNKLFTGATLIIAPNHLCGQWFREFDIHLEKPIKIINLLTKVHYKKFSYYDFMNADVVIVSANFFFNCNINQHENINPLYNFINIFNKDVNLFTLYWNRVVIDEYHEIEESALFEKLKFLESNFRWIISGTPFKEHTVSEISSLESTSLSKITDYLTWNSNIINRIDFSLAENYNYVKNHFSRNTHKKNVSILKLPEIKETTVWLNFSETERVIYNAYLADPNNTPYDVFLRQICCHPMLSEKIRENMKTKLESLSDMKTYIEKMYFTDFYKAKENYDDCVNRIDKIKNEMNDMESEDKQDLIGYKNLVEDLARLNDKKPELLKIKDGKEKTLLYYKNFLELISDMENVTQQECPICLDFIKEHDLGITICGHLFCYSCISMIIKEAKTSSTPSKCPNCNKNTNLDNIFMISQNKSKDIDVFGTKLAYIINYIKSTPDKYRIIFSQWDYLLKEVGKVLEQNNIKHLYCQGNVYQKDKVLRLFNSKDTVNNQYKIIMLSSDSTVSGSNLNNAEEVIFLDPVYGDKAHRLNTENQAIGRVRRLGNKFKTINVLRLLIKDSVEEEIYKNNFTQK
jgi:DNA repair protein RAD5